MKKVYINEYGPQVSAAVYSFWRWNEVDFKTSNPFKEIVTFTRDLGITTYDLSPRFGNGLIEQEFGKLIKDGVINPQETVLMTKVGIRDGEEALSGQRYYDLSPQNLIQSVEASLKRLNVETIDVLILEHFDFLIHFEQTASTLLKLQRSGKVKHFGVSDFNVFQQRLLSTALSQPIITNHVELNLLQTAVLHDGRLDFIREQHSRPLAFSPLADGRILLGEDRQAVRLREALIQTGRKYEANVEQVAVAWLHKLGALPLIGSKDKRRIQNAATAHAFQLTQEDWYYLYNASK